MEDSINISEIAEMWGTNDERVGIKLYDGQVWFVQEIKVYHQFMLGNFSKK